MYNYKLSKERQQLWDKTEGFDPLKFALCVIGVAFVVAMLIVNLVFLFYKLI